MEEQLDLFGEPVRERAKSIQGLVGKGDYEAFLAKFDAPKTTDDCYTPAEVYEAVLGWLRERADLSGLDVVRPFFPGGDYERYPYKDTDVVIDNPPFSILEGIVRFYASRGVRFFLFAPQLTLFRQTPGVTHIGCSATLEYANGARVNTGFVTNLLGDAAAMSAPDLRRRITEAQDRARPSRAMPVYRYPDEVLTASMLGYMSTRGVEFTVRWGDVARRIAGLASQRACGKAIFGGGFLLSEKAAAEKAAAEKANAIVWELSPAEREAVRRCGKVDSKVTNEIFDK